ncbi:MAG TPA: coenzyme F420-0:L-glutamate ligase [Limnochordia bacterium]|nr:coenzyme F420-0:L-glutamate ligase [Limnochordia bacterium]
MRPNPGKELTLEVEGKRYLRIPVQTDLIQATDSIVQVVKRYIEGVLHGNDLIVVSEKVVAITQGRAYRISEIKPSRLAVFLSRFVHKSPHGIGLGMPETMELAIQEVGALKIVFASVIAALGKLFGIKGLFYRICGPKARAIDGPCEYTIPPFHDYAVLGPKDPDLVARQIKEALGAHVAVIDANDLGVNILGVSGPEVDVPLLTKLLKDNPLGQSSERTPLGIIRVAEETQFAGEVDDLTL